MLTDDALAALAKRKALSQAATRIDNASLPAGAPMYFYCQECGDLAAVLPEGFTQRPPRFCSPCQRLAEAGLIV
jgi:hypothetical protein